MYFCLFKYFNDRVLVFGVSSFLFTSLKVIPVLMFTTLFVVDS